MSDRFRRSPNALSADVGDDVVALHTGRGYCYGMEQVTADVWRQLAEPASADQLVDHLSTLYDVDPATCRADVAELLGRLEAEGLAERIAA